MALPQPWDGFKQTLEAVVTPFLRARHVPTVGVRALFALLERPARIAPLIRLNRPIAERAQKFVSYIYIE